MQGGRLGLPYNALAPWPLGWRSDKQESGSVSVWTRDYPRLSGTNTLSGWLPSLLCIFFEWYPQQRFSFSFNSLANYEELSCKRTLLESFPIEMYTWNFISNHKCISFGGSINYYHTPAGRSKLLKNEKELSRWSWSNERIQTDTKCSNLFFAGHHREKHHCMVAGRLNWIMCALTLWWSENNEWQRWTADAKWGQCIVLRPRLILFFLQSDHFSSIIQGDF